MSDTRALKAVTTVDAFPLDGSVKTLGWAVVAWIEAYLVQPDGDDAGDPFRLTPEQINFILWFYAVDAAGNFVYRRSVLRRSKGWGKSPFLGALCLAELCGPVRFGGWDRHGEPVAVRHSSPWVVIAGVSENQTANTLDAIRSLVEGSPLVDEVGLDVGLTRIFVNGQGIRGKLMPITASSSTQEGARPTFAVMDETHHWTESNGGAKLARVIRRNLAKARDGSARSIETTNAHAPNEGSVAEVSFKAYLAIREGRTARAGLLYDSREAPPGIDLADEDQLRAGLRCAYGDATWVDLDRFIGEIYDPGTPPEEARRFYLNQIVAAADAWLRPTDLATNRNEELPALAAGDTVTLGFDGGLTDDSSALVAVRVSDGAVFLLGIWEKPEGPAGKGWQVDKERVRETVDHAFALFDVVAFFSDVAYWETDVDHWRDAYGEKLLVKATTRHAVAWDMRGHQAETVRATEALHRAFLDREVPFGPHETIDGRPGAAEILTRHIENARSRPNRWGYSFGKESRESPNKVDALAALLLARMARTRVLGEGVLKRRRKRTGRLYGFS